MTKEEVTSDPGLLEQVKYYNSDKFNSLKDLQNSYYDGTWKRPTNPEDVGISLYKEDSSGPMYKQDQTMNEATINHFNELSDEEVINKQYQHLQNQIYLKDINEAYEAAYKADEAYRKEIFAKHGMEGEDLYERLTGDSPANIEANENELLTKIMGEIENIENPILRDHKTYQKYYHYDPSNDWTIGSSYLDPDDPNYVSKEEEEKIMREVYGDDKKNWPITPEQEYLNEGYRPSTQSNLQHITQSQINSMASGYRSSYFGDATLEEATNRYIGINPLTGNSYGSEGPGNYDYGRNSNPYGYFEHNKETKEQLGNLGSKVFHETLKKEFENRGLSSHYDMALTDMTQQGVKSYEQGLVDMHEGTMDQHKLYEKGKENYKQKEAGTLSDIWYGLTNPIHTADYLSGNSDISPSDRRFFNYTGETRKSDKYFWDNFAGAPAHMLGWLGNTAYTIPAAFAGAGPEFGSYSRAEDYNIMAQNPYYFFNSRLNPKKKKKDSDRPGGFVGNTNIVDEHGNLIRNTHGLFGDNDSSLYDNSGSLHSQHREYAYDQYGVSGMDLISAGMLALPIGKVVSPLFKSIGRIPSFGRYLMNPKKHGMPLLPGGKPLYYAPKEGANYGLGISLGKNRGIYTGKPLHVGMEAPISTSGIYRRTVTPLEKTPGWSHPPGAQISYKPSLLYNRYQKPYKPFTKHGSYYPGEFGLPGQLQRKTFGDYINPALRTAGQW